MKFSIDSLMQVVDTVQFWSKVKVNQSRYRPAVARGFQEVKVLRFHDNDTGWW